MKIVVIGTGYVGLPHAAVCAEYGHDVYAFDVDEDRINAYKTGERAQIERYVNEPSLSSLVSEVINRHLFFTTNLDDITEGADAFFMCLNTPPQRDGSTDLNIFEGAAHMLGEALARRKNKKRVLVINKSTVPIGTVRLMQKILKEHGIEDFGVASNPEFLAQGKAVEGSRRPDRVVVGADSPKDLEILRNIYPQFVDHVRIEYLETTPETAEAIKYVANTLLLTYISFWNGVGARLAETFDNIRMADLRKGVTSDDRISTWGSYVSNGAGGSCLGKDIQSLIYQLNTHQQRTELLDAVYKVNETQKMYMVERAIHEVGFNFNGKKVALLGLAFKKRTNDMRDSPAIKAVESLLGKGVAEIRAYDPLAMDQAKSFWLNPDKNWLFEQISYHPSMQEALRGTDAVYISTDWEEFRGLTPVILECVQPPYLVIDGRRMISDYQTLVENNITYLSVGGKALAGKLADKSK
jgi:UDPglucose 6-dehydrogenase